MHSTALPCVILRWRKNSSIKAEAEIKRETKKRESNISRNQLKKARAITEEHKLPTICLTPKHCIWDRKKRRKLKRQAWRSQGITHRSPLPEAIAQDVVKYRAVGSNWAAPLHANGTRLRRQVARISHVDQTRIDVICHIWKQEEKL